MPTIVFKLPNGTEQVVDYAPGSTVMQVALGADVPGIVGECGGNLACATCHVLIDIADSCKFDKISDIEDAMLDGATERADRSRLGCQLVLNESHAGLVIVVPETEV